MEKWARRTQEAQKSIRKDGDLTQTAHEVTSSSTSTSPDKAQTKVLQPETQPKASNGVPQPGTSTAPTTSKESQDKLNRWLNRTQPGAQKSPAAAESANGKGKVEPTTVQPATNASNGIANQNVANPPTANGTPNRVERWIRKVQTSPKPPSDLLDLGKDTPIAPANGAGSDPSDPHGLSKLKDTAIDDVDLHTAISESKNAPRPPPDPSGGQDGWQKISFENGDYEGEFKDGAPHGFGRIQWKNGVGYHGQFVGQKFHGKGCFFFENGDRCVPRN